MTDYSNKSFSSVSDIDTLVNANKMQLDNKKATVEETRNHDKNRASNTDLEADSASTTRDKKISNLDDDIIPHSTTDSKVRGRPSACVFVASLCATLTDDQLCISVTNHFKQWGNLSTVKVLRDTANRPYAFVQYTNEKDSKIAITEGHNTILDGRNIRCEAAKVNRTLFIRSRYMATEFTLRHILQEFGELENLSSSDRFGNLVPKYSKGSKYWYCKFAFRDDAIRAFANLTENKLFNAEWAQNIDEIYKKTERKDSSKLPKFDKFSVFVGQLNIKTTEDELRKRFELHGEIEEVTVVRKNTNTFGFIKYTSESSAASAVERENHAMLNNKTMHVQYREIHPPSTRTVANKYGGLALAPPPINLGKRSVSQKNSRSSDSNVQLKLNSVNHNTFPLTSKKYNEISNHYHKGNNSKENSQNFTSTNHQKPYALKHSNIANLPDKNKFGKPYVLSGKLNSHSPKGETPTSPVSVETSDLTVLVKSGYSSTAVVEKENSEDTDNLVSTREEEVPFFYYSSNTETTNSSPNSENKFAGNYYYPYQQFYFPYEPSQFQCIFGIPTIPVFFPRSGSENNLESNSPI